MKMGSSLAWSVPHKRGKGTADRVVALQLETTALYWVAQGSLEWDHLLLKRASRVGFYPESQRE